MKRRLRLGYLVPPLLVVLCLLAPFLIWGELSVDLGTLLDGVVPGIEKALAVAMWLGLAWLLVRCLDVFVWEALVEPRIGQKIPKLLKDVLGVLIFVAVLTQILSKLFQVSVTGIWATTGAAGIILGLALQSMISDIFQGIAINVDRPFKIGDWLRLKASGETTIGCVKEINWKTTRILTIENTLLVIPNHQITAIPIWNLNLPSPPVRYEISFTLDFGINPDRATRILKAAAFAAEGVMEQPEPAALISDTTRAGVVYTIRYWIIPSQVDAMRARHNVARSALTQLHQAGIVPAYEKVDTFVARMPEREPTLETSRVRILRRIYLFEELSEEEIGQLAERIKERTVAAGVDVVRQGDEGDSMFVLVEGLMFVSALDQGVEPVRIGRINPGEFFGDMSLMTGEPRSATVTATTDCLVYEIDRSDLLPLLEARPGIGERISESIAARNLSRDAAFVAAGEKEREERSRSTAAKIRGRIFKLFGIQKPGSSPAGS